MVRNSEIDAFFYRDVPPAFELRVTLESNARDWGLDVKKRFTEEQVIGFLREAEAGLALAELCQWHCFSEASYYLWRSKFDGINVSNAFMPPKRKRYL